MTRADSNFSLRCRASPAVRMWESDAILSAEEVGGAGLNGMIAPPPRPFLDARVCPRA